MNGDITIHEAEILNLRDEAAAHGDLEQVSVCNAALTGDENAWTECERVIRDARGLAESYRTTHTGAWNRAQARPIDEAGTGEQS